MIKKFFIFIFYIIFSLIFGIFGAFLYFSYFHNYISDNTSIIKNLHTTIIQEEISDSQLIKIINNIENSVVSFGFERIINNQIDEQVVANAFFITNDGLLITNKHVLVEDNVKYFIKYKNKIYCELLSIHPYKDIAIFKLIVEENEKYSFNPLEFINDKKLLSIGQIVLNISKINDNLFSSMGILTSKNAKIQTYEYRNFNLDNLISADFLLLSGASGSPAVNLNGQIIGVNTAISFDYKDMSFITPIDNHDINWILYNIKEYDKILMPFLGINYTIITEDVKEKHNLSTNYGAYLYIENDNAILPNSSAFLAGLQEEDIILKIDDTRIIEEKDLISIINNLYMGQNLNLEILRNNEKIYKELIIHNLDETEI